MREDRAVDDALRGIVVDIDAFELIEERIAVAKPGAHASRRPRFAKRALHAVLAQRVGARPFRDLPVLAALDARLEAPFRG